MSVLFSDDYAAIEAYLNEHPEDVNVYSDDNRRYTPLYSAIKKDRIDIVELLILRGADLNKATGLSKFFPLQLAVQKEYIDILDLLIYYGADVNINPRETALHTAAKGGKVDAINRLLAAGANPNIQSFRKEIPILLAAERGYLDIIKLLTVDSQIGYEDYFGKTVINYAIRGKHVDIVDYFLNLGMYINHTDNKGQSYLFEAVKIYDTNRAYAIRNYKNIEEYNFDILSIIKMLLDWGIDIHISDKKGRTAAKFTEAPEVLQLIL